MDAQQKTTIESVAVVGLLVVLGFTLVTSLKRSGLRFPLRSAPQGAPPVQAGSAATPPSGETTTAAPTVRYTASELRNPLKSLLPQDEKATPPVASQGPQALPTSAGRPSALPRLVVEGVVWGGVEPKAIINHEVYGVGDVVEGAVVTSIQRDGVTLDVAGRTIRLTATRSQTSQPTPQATWR